MPARKLIVLVLGGAVALLTLITLASLSGPVARLNRQTRGLSLRALRSLLRGLGFTSDPELRRPDTS
jgi:hypothetical protein